MRFARMCRGIRKRWNVVYRFWELFDHDRIPVAPHIMEMLETGAIVSVSSPPMRPFQEEKLKPRALPSSPP